jgi:hypothetical protein
MLRKKRKASNARALTAALDALFDDDDEDEEDDGLFHSSADPVDHLKKSTINKCFF